MTPKILEYLDGQISITPEAYVVKELNDIIMRYGTEDGLPYLTYVHLMTWPESPYINLPEDEKKDTIIYDVSTTVGEFDSSDDLLDPAIKRLEKAWETRPKRYYEALGSIMDKVIAHSKTSSITDDNLSEFNKMLKEGGSTFKSYREVEKIVDDEIRAKMKGKSILGDY